jgi:muramidase (phage lysozyme)
MADNDVIREFLVKLGWQIDESGMRRFTESILGATKVAVEMGAAVIGAATGVVAAVTKMSEAGERLYYIAQRTKAAAANIQAFGYAVSQMGGTAEGARQSLENLANFLRSSPGAGGLLRSLGINPNEDSTNILEDLGNRLRAMPRYRANVIAATLGIDQTTLNALLQGVQGFVSSYQSMLAKAGLNSDQYAKSSHDFMVQIRELGAAFSILGMKVNQSLAKGMANDVKQFRMLLVDNFQVVSDFIVMVTKGVLAAANATITLIVSAVQGFRALAIWFKSLPPGVQQVIEGFAALLVAWRLLNTAFLSSPIGIIAALATAILLLWQDYQVWKAGGKSLIDWGKWKPDIDQAIAGIKQLAAVLNNVAQAVGGWRVVLEAFAVYIAGSWLTRVTRAFAAAGASADISLAKFNALLIALGAVEKANQPIPLKDLPIGSPWWQQVPEQQQRLYPNSPYNQQRYPNSNRDPGLWGGSSRWTPWGIFQRLFGSSGTKGKSDVSNAIPPEGKALLDVIGAGESGGDYSRSYGDAPDITSYANHPHQEFAGPNGTTTSAAGKYQFEAGTYDRLAKLLGLTDFTPESQDRAAWALAQQDYFAHTGRNLDADLKSNDPKRLAMIGQVLHSTWTSLTGSNQMATALQERLRVDQPTPRTDATPARPQGLSLPQHASIEGSSRLMGAPAMPPHSVLHHYNTTINQNNTINVNGAKDPQKVADAVQGHQQKFNSRIMRNLPPRVA